jgi:hypothetical protein
MKKARVRTVLQGVPDRLSFAVDAWTSRNAHAFLGITVHWIDAEWQLRHVPLHIPALVDRRRGKDLRAAFTAACGDFRVLLKLLVITSDAPRTGLRAASSRGCVSW